MVLTRVRRSRWLSVWTLSLTIGTVMTFLVGHRAQAMQFPDSLVIAGEETTEEWSRVMAPDASGKTGSVPNTVILSTQPGNAPTGNLIAGPPIAAMRDGFGNSVTFSAASTVISMPTIRITSPAAGSVIDRLTILVRGELAAPAGMDVGVSVNGSPGFVGGHQFVALMRVTPAVTALTATAHSFTGTLATESIPVTVQASAIEPPFTLNAAPHGGLAPLTVSFDLQPRIELRQFSLDADGDGTGDLQGSRLLTGVSFTFSKPGLYVPHVTLTDGGGQPGIATTIVEVYDRVTVDQHLQAVWHGIREALRVGDVSRAVSFIHSSVRERYRAQFAQLGPTRRASVDQIMASIKLLRVDFGGAQYEMLRSEDGRTFSYAVWFEQDFDGLWRLRRF